jgi:protein-S-isoprenylcysteine O-methyltransferase Ste14
MLAREMADRGEWLFRHRSYLPALLVCPLVVGLVGNGRSMAGGPAWWFPLCLCVSLLGLVLRGATVGCVPPETSGRNTRRQKAEHLNTTGLYSVVRHPLYLGNFAIWTGIVLTLRDWGVLLLFACIFWLYYERIIAAEERFLNQRFGAAYRAWSRRTPAFVPRLSRWRPPVLRFSMRAVLAREYCGLLGLGTAHPLAAMVDQVLTGGPVRPHWSWWAVLLTGSVGFLLLRTLKKRTRLLDVPDLPSRSGISQRERRTQRRAGEMHRWMRRILNDH